MIDYEAKHRAPADPDRAITRCWQNNGWHAHMAGPCFDTIQEARAFRDEEELAQENKLGEMARHTARFSQRQDGRHAR